MFNCFKRNKETITKSRIPICDITEFYYTIINIDYDASYLRYRFYLSDEKYYFEYEIREKKGEYGETTEKDIIKKGTYELSNNEWVEFLSFLKDGTISKRKELISSGDKGPWMYLYWKNDKGKLQVFDFASYETRIRFEQFCENLMNKND